MGIRKEKTGALIRKGIETRNSSAERVVFLQGPIFFWGLGLHMEIQQMDPLDLGDPLLKMWYPLPWHNSRKQIGHLPSERLESVSIVQSFQWKSGFHLRNGPKKGEHEFSVVGFFVLPISPIIFRGFRGPPSGALAPSRAGLEATFRKSFGAICPGAKWRKNYSWERRPCRRWE